MPRPQSPLTKFILSLPADLPAAEVVAKAKEKGLTTTPENVAKVRSRNRTTLKGAAKSAKKPATPKKRAAKKAAKKAAATSAKKTAAAPASKPEEKHATGPSKSDFIRSFSPSVPANEVVEKAKAAGIPGLRAHLVYEVRRADRLRAAKHAKRGAAPKHVAPKKAAPGRAAAHAKPVAAAGRASAEELLRAVAAEVGLARAIDILDQQRQHVLRVLGG